jgi:polyadenylation factor subunit 2
VRFSSHRRILSALTSVSPPAVAWHPLHPILVSGGSEGSILHWDLSATSESSTSPITPVGQPRATLSQAHDSNVWSLSFHPLGHLLVSASNDHTTRFWSRERPGDASSVFSGGGEKPPEEAVEDDDEVVVPGFTYSGGVDWWGKEEDAYAQSTSVSENGLARGVDGAANDDFVIPGFGAAENARAGPSSLQDDFYGVGGSGGGGDAWNREGSAGRSTRWGPRRGGAPRY